MGEQDLQGIFTGTSNQSLSEPVQEKNPLFNYLSTGNLTKKVYWT
jgi:hypothetical protein